MFKYSDEFTEWPDTLRLIEQCARNERFWPEFCWAVPMISWNYPTDRDAWHVR